MITIRLEPCCKDCGFSKIVTDERNTYDFEGIYDTHVTISCENERICRFRKDQLGRPIKPMEWGDDEHQGPKRLV